MQIQNRVQQLVHVKASELVSNPLNFREHPEKQREALRGLLEEVGIAGAVLARKVKKKYVLIDGHLRQEELTKMGDQEIPVLVLDVNEDEANKLLAAYDPISSLAETNQAKFKELIQKVSTDSKPLASLFSSIASFKKGELELELDIEDDGTTAPEETTAPTSTELKSSHVRMVQLFLNIETQPMFEELVREQAEKLGTVNLTDTVFATMWSIVKNDNKWKKYVEAEE